MNKQQVIELVNSNLSSVFTKEDVVNVINMITESNVDLASIKEQVRKVLESIERCEEGVDEDSVEFTVDDNYISVQRACINSSYIMDELDEKIFNK